MNDRDPVLTARAITPRSMATRPRHCCGRGELVAFPTDTVYGVARSPGMRPPSASSTRPSCAALDKAIPMLLADPADLALVARDLPPAAVRLAERFWPGPLTLVVPKAPARPGRSDGRRRHRRGARARSSAGPRADPRRPARRWRPPAPTSPARPARSPPRRSPRNSATASPDPGRRALSGRRAVDGGGCDRRAARHPAAGADQPGRYSRRGVTSTRTFWPLTG